MPWIAWLPTGIVAFALCVLLWAVAPERAGFESEPLLAAAERYDVRVLRDHYGVPHIYGARDVDVAYGLAFAHSEDDFATIQEMLLAVRGELASQRGRAGAAIDFLVQWTRVWERIDAGYESQLSPATRALARAYADGVNHYAALHRSEALPGLIPLRGEDIAAGFVFNMPLFYGLDRTIRPLFDEDRPRPSADAVARYVHSATAHLGSNAVAVAPSRSADGATRLLVNSHQPYTGPVAWYEARLSSGEGWNVAGGFFPGAPIMLHGHGRTLGWASTVNTPDLADVYRLEIDPQDRNRYRIDAHWYELERDEVTLHVQLLGRLRWPFKRERLRSRHGPAVERADGTYALRFAGMDEVRGLEQFYRMNKATNFDEWRDAMRMQAIPSLNFVYADRDGNIGYFYNAKFPIRAPGYDWRGDVPGDRSETLWHDYVSFDAGPHTVNPASGFVVSANHSPFRASAPGDGPDEAGFSERLGIERRMTNRGLRALELWGGDPSITRDEFRRYKYDKRYAREGPVGELVRRIVEADLSGDTEQAEDLAAGQRLLSAWAYTAEIDDRGTALAVLSATPTLMAHFAREPEPDLLASYRAAVATLREHHGRIDPTWGEVNRFRRGAIDAAAGGGPDTLRAIESYVLEEDGTYTARKGDSLVMFVEWDARGALRSESIHQFGSATLDASSPHYADQVELFLAERTKPVLFDEARLRASLEREYQPGD